MLSSEQNKVLCELAHYIWWQTTEESLNKPMRLVAQVMDRGTLSDAAKIVRVFGDDYLRNVIANARAGWFHPKSWHYWHYKLGLTRIGDVVPPLPRRIIQ